ncbi:MAG: mechanosensitive ion channel family protein [Gemmatimonadota bacterium]
MLLGIQAAPSGTMVETITAWLNTHPLIETGLGVVALLLAAWLTDVPARRYILRALERLIERSPVDWDDIVQHHGVFERLAHLVPMAVIYFGITLIPGVPDGAVSVVRAVAIILVIFIVIRSADGFLTAVNEIYEQAPISRSRPIKGYVQVVKIFMYVMGGILIVSVALDQSPLILLGGFGALTAVLLLVFKDTILSLVASVQIASNDMMRIGDWVELPQHGADGDVIEIALHTVKIQNWDKTVSTIPTHKFIAEGFRNWRYMSESGGRRIKRSLFVDQGTIRFLSDEEVERFKRFELLRDYVEAKQQALGEANRPLAGASSDEVNARRLTNIGTFRAYIFRYLQNHPSINREMTLLVQQRDPTPAGLPIQIYCFTATTEWGEYEGIQADIFDHILATVPEFGLRIFQHPSGEDLRHLGPTGATAHD